jgi:FdhE protein
MTRDTWLSRHSYLEPAAQLHTLVDAAVAGILIERPCAPIWDDYTANFEQGVPLLESSSATIDLTAAANSVVWLMAHLASAPLAGHVAGETRALDSELRCDPEAPRRAIAWLLYGELYASAYPGLLRYFGWAALAQYLCPLVDAFAQWRDEERWLRNYCPTCGSRPSMAQLVGSDAGRLRLLSCAFCKTRWRYRRTGCPFCENQNDHALAVLAVEGEGGLRLDYCESCRGYLKTYDGEGSENVMLADWTSIHLDVLAGNRGLKRLAASLYSLPI